MQNTLTGFGRELEDEEDIRKNPKFNFPKKPSELGGAGFNRYGDFLGFGKKASEEQSSIGAYQSPFTTLQKEDWKYDESGQLKNQSQRDLQNRGLGAGNLIQNKPTVPELGQSKIGQPRPQPRQSPYSSIMGSYKRI